MITIQKWMGITHSGKNEHPYDASVYDATWSLNIRCKEIEKLNNVEIVAVDFDGKITWKKHVDTTQPKSA